MLCAVWLELHYGVHPLQPQIDCLFSIFCPMVDWRKRNRQWNSEKQLHEKWRQWMLVAVLFVWLNVSRRYWTQTNLKVKWQRIFTGESSQLWFSFVQMKCRFTALDWPRGRPHAGTCISSERWSRKKNGKNNCESIRWWFVRNTNDSTAWSAEFFASKCAAEWTFCGRMVDEMKFTHCCMRK